MVPQYKYLGTVISAELSLLPHLREIARKVNFITFQLRAVLNRGHLRLNTNLFRLFVLPSYRLLLTLVPLAHTKQVRLVEKELRQAFRRFVRLPQSCPNEFIAKLIGTLEEMATNLNRASALKIAARNQFRPLNSRESCELQEIRSLTTSCNILPNDLLAAIQIAYSRKCTACNRLCTFGHLKDVHRVSPFTLPQILTRLQSPKARRSAKTDIKKILRALATLTNRPATKTTN